MPRTWCCNRGRSRSRADQDAADRASAQPWACCPENTAAEIATGSSWVDAMDELEWEPGEVLVVGSSPVGTLARVFLGSRAIKIVRYSPVPVVVVPAGIAAEAANAVEAGAEPGPPFQAGEG